MDNAANFPLLSLILFTPLVGAIVLLFVGKGSDNLIRLLANVFTFVGFLVSLPLWFMYDSSNPGWQFVERAPWIPSIGADYFLGIDGFSCLLILLTTLMGFLAVLSSWTAITERVREYYIFLLVLQTGMLGAFMSLDFLLFFLFWEVMLVPMYFLIGIWGSDRRLYSAIKFFLYTLVGSVVMLLGILALYFYAYGETGVYSFDITRFQELNMPLDLQIWIFLTFFLGFAIKVPMFPFHTWLPDAHTEAPTAGSIILAAVLLKMGTYGIIRFSMELFPIMFIKYAWLLAVFGVIGIIYGALVCIAQKDVKKLVAYSSVSHMGFILLGLAALNVEAMQGALIQMVNHGLSTGALFMFVGFLYDRRHTREIADYGGILKVVPIFGSLLLVICLSSIGLPGLNGFIGEFMILIGAFNSALLNNHTYTILGTTGVVLSAVYLLWMYQRVLLGPLDKDENKSISDLNLRETIASSLIIVFIVWIGVYPNTFLSKSEASMKKVIENVETAKRNLLKIP